MLGGIPKRDIEALQNYWTIYPSLKGDLFKIIEERPDYYQLDIENEEIKNSIFQHSEFKAFGEKMNLVFEQWRSETVAHAKLLEKDLKPKQEIFKLSENLLKLYDNKPLTDKYAVYQHLMDYWAETMQDDFYAIAADGWKAGNVVIRLEKTTKKGNKETVRQILGIEGLEGRLIPPALIIQEYFSVEQNEIDELKNQLENVTAEMDEMREENGGEDGLLNEVMNDQGKITKTDITKAIKEASSLFGDKDDEADEELEMLQRYKGLMDEETEIKSKIKTAELELKEKVILQYPELSIDEIKTIVIEKKWMHNIEERIRTEMDNISHRLTERIKELAERYKTPLPTLANSVKDLEKTVGGHLEKMGFVQRTVA